MESCNRHCWPEVAFRSAGAVALVVLLVAGGFAIGLAVAVVGAAALTVQVVAECGPHCLDTLVEMYQAARGVQTMVANPN